jgi:sugar phosphate isomerase/epimerase
MRIVTSRRSFLAGALATAALPARRTFAGAVKSKVALQMYSVGRYVREVQTGGFAAVFKELADLGYKGVEFAGYSDFGNKPRTAKEMKKMLDDAGLVACGTHIGRDALAPQRIQRTIDSNLEVGNRLLVCPSGLYTPEKDFKGTMDDWAKMLAEFYSTAAENAKKSGVRVGYHNHVKEFTTKVADGRCVWDAFFSACSPDVCMELDVGWCATAGEDPCAWLKRFPRRSPTIHAKEHANARSSIFGDIPAGKKGVDWDALFAVTDENGVEWYVVETESMERKTMVPPKGCIEFLKKKGRA